jgi:hypothetical protein
MLYTVVELLLYTVLEFLFYTVVELLLYTVLEFLFYTVLEFLFYAVVELLLYTVVELLSNRRHKVLLIALQSSKTNHQLTKKTPPTLSPTSNFIQIHRSNFSSFQIAQ